MNVEQTIIELLYRYECVIVSGFGGFVTQRKPAKFDPINYKFSPSTKKVGFNSNLTQSDGLLENKLAKLHDISYEEASDFILKTTNEWMDTLEGKGVFALRGLGKFTKDKNDLFFLPEEEANFSLSSYGLASINANYISREERVLIQPNHRIAWGSYVATIGFALLIGGGGFFANQQLVKTQFSSILPIFKTEMLNKTHEVKQNAPIIDIENAFIPEQIIEDAAPVNEIPDIENNSILTEKEEGKTESKETLDLSVRPFQVIGGSFKNYSRAMKHEAFLRNKGYEKARIIGKVGNFFMVAFDSFDTKDEALNYKRELDKKGIDVFIRY